MPMAGRDPSLILRGCQVTNCCPLINIKSRHSFQCFSGRRPQLFHVAISKDESVLSERIHVGIKVRNETYAARPMGSCGASLYRPSLREYSFCSPFSLIRTGASRRCEFMRGLPRWEVSRNIGGSDASVNAIRCAGAGSS